MRRVALTGGIATGKSYVTARLRKAGVPVVDADVLAREVVAPGSPGLTAIVHRFGPGVIRADGTLDRAALGERVFADAAARRDLEAIVHPAVRTAIDRFFSSLPPATPLAVADIPLLFETGRAGDFDTVVVVACRPETQVSRVMARDGLSRAQAEARLAAQLPIADKVARADHVIWTDGTFADTDRQVEALLAYISADD
jgi:dephospho-CoA kinase